MKANREHCAQRNTAITEFLLFREMHYLTLSAYQEPDLQARLDRLYRAADVLESVSRIMPELDSAFWYAWLDRKIDAVWEQIAELHEDGDGWTAPA